MEQKKQWEKPHLVVLGRGTPEESVLATCKQQQSAQGGPDGTTCHQGIGGWCRTNSTT